MLCGSSHGSSLSGKCAAHHYPDSNRKKVPWTESTKGKAWAAVNFQNLPFKFKLKKGCGYEDLDQATRDRIDAEL